MVFHNGTLFPEPCANVFAEQEGWKECVAGLGVVSGDFSSLQQCFRGAATGWDAVLYAILAYSHYAAFSKVHVLSIYTKYMLILF